MELEESSFLGEGNGTHSSTLAWEIPRREEPGRLQSMESLRVGHDCREPARDIPLVTKVMRKEARHMQRRDRASGVPLDILKHLPQKNQSLPTLLLCALTSDFTGGCPLPPSRSL